jgi:hypothetical protein
MELKAGSEFCRLAQDRLGRGNLGPQSVGRGRRLTVAQRPASRSGLMPFRSGYRLKQQFEMVAHPGFEPTEVLLILIWLQVAPAWLINKIEIGQMS